MRSIAHHVGPTDASALHDELLKALPSGARHDVDICPFCVEKASQADPVPTSGPSGLVPSGVSDSSNPTTEGGNTGMSNTPETISMETHQALLEKALKDATSTTESALERKTEEASSLSTKVTELETANSDLKADNDRLNKSLDEAQVQLKTSTDEVAALKADIASKDEAAKKAEIASARSDQVANLGLFTKEYIVEKASKWADLADEDWTEKLEEWRGIKPATVEGDAAGSDTASAMSGTSESLTTEPVADTASETKSVRPGRAVLGLTS